MKLSSIWIEASAGSGKTYQLVRRVLTLLLQDIHPRSMVCLTYTNNAATEMATRLTEEILKWATLPEDALKKELEKWTEQKPDAETVARARGLVGRILELPQGLPVKTVHAFCHTILARFPFEIGVPTRLELLDESESKQLNQQALRALLTRPEQKQAFSFLVREMTSDQVLEAMSKLKTVFAKNPATSAGVPGMLGIPWASPDEQNELHDKLCAIYDLEEITDQEVLRKTFEKENANTLARLGQSLETHKSYLEEKEKKARTSGLPARPLLAFLETHDASLFAEIYFTGAGKPRKKLATKEDQQQCADPDLAAALEELRDEAEAFIATKARLRDASISASFLKLVPPLMETYADEKSRLGKVNYEDLIDFVLDLFQRTESHHLAFILERLEPQLAHILLDEAQDTSPKQWRILENLMTELFQRAAPGPKSLFVVGDPKQSIFGFQGADIEGYQKAHQNLKQIVTQTSRLWEEESLTRSFRSRQEILTFVDTVFEDAGLRDGLGGPLTQHEAARHKELGGYIELWPLLKDARQPTLDTLPDPSQQLLDRPTKAAEAMAQQLVEKIQQLTAHDTVYDPKLGLHRKVRYSDIKILFRKRSPCMRFLCRKLNANHLPFSTLDDRSILEHLVVMDCLALFRFCLLPLDDLNLASLLKSDLIQLDRDDPTEEPNLTSLCRERSETKFGNLFGSLRARARTDGGRWQTIAQWLENWLRRADTMRPSDGLAELFYKPCPANDPANDPANEDGTGGAGGVGLTALRASSGFETLAVLDQLRNLAFTYEQNHTPHWEGFLSWLEAEARPLRNDPENPRDEIRLLTIHGAKGLEAPIVFIPELCSQDPRSERFIQAGVDEPPVWTAPVWTVPVWTGSKAWRSENIEAALEQEEKHRKREEARLLYVALTRAAERLYLGGIQNVNLSDEKVDESWYGAAQKAMEKIGREEAHGVYAYGRRYLQTDTGQGGMQGSMAAERTGSTGGPVPETAATETAPASLAFLKTPLPPTERESPGVVPDKNKILRARHYRSPLATRAEDPRLRGVLIHKLLEKLPGLPETERLPRAEQWLKSQNIRDAQIQDLLRHVMKLFEVYPFLHTTHGRREVAISGLVPPDQEFVSTRIDFLAFLPRATLVVEYKTYQRPPERVEQLGAQERDQLRLYHYLVRQVYPDKPVELALVWTTLPLVMPVPSAAIDPL